jgi:16S rRNA processing protein RimM
MKNKVAIGEVVSPSGFKGHFRINSFTEKKENFFKYGPVFINDELNKINLVKIKSFKEMFIVSCENITTKEQVDNIRGSLIFTERAKLPNLNQDSFYYHDLIDMKVINEKNVNLGNVVSVNNYGADDIIEIKSNSSNDTNLIPINKKFIIEIRLNEKEILVKNIDGYLNEKNI